MVFVHSIARMASAAGFMGVITYLSVTLLPLSTDDQSFFSSFPKFALIVTISGLAYFALSYWMKLDEVQPILTRVKKIIFYRNR